MGEQARVTSLEALELFRANLINFSTTAQANLDEVSDEVRRVRAWLQHEQRPHWEREIRRRTRILGDAKQELLSAKLSGLRDNFQPQEEAVRKARRALEEAEEKLQAVKRWTRDYDHAVEPLVRRIQGFREVLDFEMPKGLAYLVQVQKTLEDYSRSPPA